ncbi:MAG: branched-chain amino acid ABC transporter permease [Candidatus Bathyarchaeia archaeon]
MAGVKDKRYICVIYLIALFLFTIFIGYAAVWQGYSLYVLLQSVISGLFLGSFYALLATGLTLSMGVAMLLNLTHGELVVLGGYITYLTWIYLGIEPLLAIPLAAITSSAVGAVIQGLVFGITRPERRVRAGERESIFQALLIMFALSIVLQNIMTMVFTAEQRTVISFLTGKSFNIFGYIIPYTRLVALILALFSILGIHFFIFKTRTGIRIRATAQEKIAARLHGINVESTSILTFSLASATAGIAGALLAITTSFNAFSGINFIFFAFTIMVLAGFGEIKGVIVTGIVVGIAESLVALFAGEAYRTLAVNILLLALFLIKPSGFFAKRMR